MICKACGYDNNEDSQFCSQCGFPLSIEEGNLVSDSLADDVERLGLKNGAIPYVIDGLKTGEFPSSLRDPSRKKLDDVERSEEDAAAQDEGDSEDPHQGSADGSSEFDDAVADDREGVMEEAAEEDAASARDSDPGDSSTGIGDDGHEEKDAFDNAPSIEHADADAQRCVGESDADPDSVPDSADVSASAEEDAGSDSAEDVAEGQTFDGGDSDSSEFAENVGAAEAEDISKGEDEDDQDDDEPIRGKHAKHSANGAFLSDAETQALEPSGEDAKADRTAGADSDDGQFDADGAVAHSGGDTSETSDVDASASYAGESEPLGPEVIPEFLRDVKPSEADAREALQNLPDTEDEIAPLQATAVMPPISTKGAIRYSTGDRDRKDAHRRRMPKLGMLLAAVVALLAIFVGVQLVNGASFGVEVPDVVGMSSDTARYELLNAGFQVDVKSQLTQDNFGIVLSSDPAAGTKRKQGSTVTITVSASRTIPDVIGMDVEAAKTKLQEEGAELVMVVAKASNQPENTVISVEPESGSAFNPQDEITLTVATHATVPNVVGMQEEDAKASVEEAGYVPEVKWADSDADAGTVVSTMPESGTSANLNSTVEIYVASPGPRDMYHLMDFYSATSADDSLYLQWKGFAVASSYVYDDDDGNAFASQMWQADDGVTISFTPVPYSVDQGYGAEDFLAQGYGYEGIRLYIPSSSALSLTTDISMETVQTYIDACGFGTPEDTCSVDDVEADNGATGKELGMPPFICSQGEEGDYIWTVLVTEDATIIGCGPKSCYEDMDPICDDVAINEMYS